MPEWARRRQEVNRAYSKVNDMPHHRSDLTTQSLVIADHSDFGHTAALAAAVADGARTAGAEVASFTNSGAKRVDKSTLRSHWRSSPLSTRTQVILSLGPGWNSPSGSERDLHRLGFWLVAGARTDVDADSDDVHPSDRATCRHLGERVAAVTRQLTLGRPLTTAVSGPEGASAPTR